MIYNYLKIAFRNLAKYKFISFINLFGLTVGLSCCLLILTYILHEVSYDRYNSKADQVCRVTRIFRNNEGVVSLHLSSVAPPIGPLLQNDFPDIQKFTRILPAGTSSMRYEDKLFNEKDLYFADENLFKIFDITLTSGNPATALTEPNSIVLTQETARKYFGNEDPINKVIRLDNRLNFKVTGIFTPLPSNSHFHPGSLVSFSTLKDSLIYGEKNLQTNWGNNAFYTYLLLPKDYPVKSLEARFPDFLDKHLSDRKTNAANLPHRYSSLTLEKLTDIHLHSHLDDELEDNGDIRRVYIFGAIAVFILLIACINYMNLSTARSSLRAKEIGIRKAAGALRREIITQFLSESVLITWIATLLAIGAAWLLLPWINKVTGLSMSMRLLWTPAVLLPLFLAPFFIGCLSGIYPALFLSSFQPVKVLKGLVKTGGGSISFRRVLVVLQFSISIILIISTVVVFQQLHFMQDKSLGLDKEHVADIQFPDGLSKNYEAFRNRLLSNPAIADAARSSRIPSGRLLDEQGASTEAGDSLRPVNADIKYLATDYDFVPTYHIRMAAGRNFSRDYSLDSSSFLLNVAATRALGLHSPQEAIGKAFKYGDTRGHIVGILEDFHFESLRQPILPMVLFLPTPRMMSGGFLGHISVKLSGSHTAEGLAWLEKTWKQFLPETPLEYVFLDEKFDQLYRSEQRQGVLFTFFAGIAIFIASLGLLGLSAFTISQRIKEIGIRKVLGASIGSIVGLVSRDFLLLVAIAAVIAFPVAWFAMHSWLQDFAYKISIHWWIFLLAGILAAAIALLTIGFQAVRAASMNPVNSLRNE